MSTSVKKKTTIKGKSKSVKKTKATLQKVQKKSRKKATNKATRKLPKGTSKKARKTAPKKVFSKKGSQQTRKGKTKKIKSKKNSCPTCLKCNRSSSCRKKDANPNFCGHHQPDRELRHFQEKEEKVSKKPVNKKTSNKTSNPKRKPKVPKEKKILKNETPPPSPRTERNHTLSNSNQKTKAETQNQEEEETEENKNDRRTAFLQKLKTLIYSSPKKSDIAISLNNNRNWFQKAMGFPESKWNVKKHLRIDQKTKNVFINDLQAGQFTQQTLGELEQKIGGAKKQKQKQKQTQTCIPIVLMIASSVSNAFVDVKALQFLAPIGSVFQVASNFNGIEGIHESSSPQDNPKYMTNYIYDKTQGPSASISAPAGSFQRIYCPTYSRTSPEIRKQDNDFQLNMLENLSSYFPIMVNGYPILFKEHPRFPLFESQEYEKCLKMGKVFAQRQTEVNIYSQGAENETYLHKGEPKQTVTQVLCSAFNVGQLPKDPQLKNEWKNASRKDSTVRVQFCLDLAYQGAYCVARQEKSQNLFLTLMGGGAFKNPKPEIVASILRQHLRFGVDERTNSLKVVYVVLFVDKKCEKIFQEQIKTLQKENVHIPLWLWSADKTKITEKFLL